MRRGNQSGERPPPPPAGKTARNLPCHSPHENPVSRCETGFFLFFSFSSGNDGKGSKLFLFTDEAALRAAPDLLSLDWRNGHDGQLIRLG